MNWASIHGLLLLPLLWPTGSSAVAAELHAHITWTEETPHVEVRLAGATPEQLEQAQAVVWLFDSNSHFLWEGKVRFAAEDKVATSVRVELKEIKEPKRRHHVQVRVAGPGLDYTTSHLLYFAASSQAMQCYGVRRAGVFPQERLFATLRPKGFKDKQAKRVPVDLELQDAQANVVMKKVESLTIQPGATVCEFEITPPQDQSVGPYRLECNLEDEVLNLLFNWSEGIAFSNAFVPVSSFEINDGTWFSTGTDPFRHREFNQSSEQFPDWIQPARSPPNQRTSTRYYSPELMDDKAPEYPVLRYDSETRRSGRQSLRIDYEEGRDAHVFSVQTLPGFPVHGRIWVKGNGSSDRLGIHWIDSSDNSKPGWARSMTWAYCELGTLDFTDWRTFRLPVVGDGLQVKSYTGNTTKVDVPIRLYALTITAKRPHPTGGQKAPALAQRSVWLDDLGTETQVTPADLISLELRSDTVDNALTEAAKLYVTVGNGAAEDIADGRLSVSIKDAAGKTVSTLNQKVAVAAGSFAVQECSLAQVHAKTPRGPLDVDVTFVAPALFGLRQTKRIVYKNPLSTGLVWDFESPDEYSGSTSELKPLGDAVVPIAGGARGSAYALRLELPQPLPGDAAATPNGDVARNVLLHPALPGEVARIRMMVKSEGAPVDLEPVLADKGMTGVSGKDANYFWLPRRRVDWQDWREVEFVAPAPPAFYQNKKRDFLRQPVYPLNLFLRAVAPSGTEGALLVDDIHAVTHLPADEELQAWVKFADATRMHALGSPLELVLNNFSANPVQVKAQWELHTFQNALIAEKTLEATVPPTQKQAATLIKAMRPGIYQLKVTGLPGPDLEELIYVLDSKQYFGADPLAFLKQVPEIRKSIGLTVEAVRLDWDNTEPVPGLFHHHWFDVVCKEKTAGGQYQVQPVLGFSADWAGYEAKDGIKDGNYIRYLPNYLQVPVRLADWDRFVRTVVRKRAGQYSHWVFWDNPDLKNGTQFIAPTRYREMLTSLDKWVSLYDPKAKVVAGGFNMDYALEYFDAFDNPSTLPFDEVAIRMNMGELSPEEGDIEGFLDELNDILQLEKTNRQARIPLLDWGIGQLITPAQQAAYHVRAALILNACGAQMHRFSCINSAQSFEGYGVFCRTRYGNSNLQDFRTVHVPKPSYFAIAHVRRFLQEWRFVKAVRIPDARPGANRAYIYRNAPGALTLVVWRAAQQPRSYRLPPSWREAEVYDAFGLAMEQKNELVCTGFPTFLRLPDNYAIDQLIHEVRMLQPTDDAGSLVLDLHVAEPASCARAAYKADGEAKAFARVSKVPGGRRWREDFVGGLKSETFSFTLETEGHALLTRLWYLQEAGQRLWVKLNDGQEQAWDLCPSEALKQAFKNPGLYAPGARQSTFVLSDCRAGVNTVSIRYEEPGNAGSYRVERQVGNHVDLARWAPLNVLQTKGEMRRYRSVQDTPLRIGKTTYHTGLGTHSVALLEFPLDCRFTAFEVTVGIDSATEGRGTVIFEIHADGKLKATSELMNGFSPAKTLSVKGLDDTHRLLLIVKDGGDGNNGDYADWVAGRLQLRNDGGNRR